jgi:hypothetical protein
MENSGIWKLELIIYSYAETQLKMLRAMSESGQAKVKLLIELYEAIRLLCIQHWVYVPKSKRRTLRKLLLKLFSLCSDKLTDRLKVPHGLELWFQLNETWENLASLQVEGAADHRPRRQAAVAIRQAIRLLAEIRVEAAKLKAKEKPQQSHDSKPDDILARRAFFEMRDCQGAARRGSTTQHPNPVHAWQRRELSRVQNGDKSCLVAS